MPLSPDLIEQLAEKKILGTITAEEQQQLSEWLQQLNAGDQLIWESQDTSEEELKIRLWNRIQESTQVHMPVARVRRIGWMKYAAAAILIIGMGAYLWNIQQKEKPAPSTEALAKVDQGILPGGNKAVLTLADGTTIQLDSATKGTIAQQGTAQVQKSVGGEIVYAAQLPGKELIYNTLTVPRGSQVVNVTLSDGTKVWLNAESSLRYPVMFVGNDRRVEITGEAYFEVAKNKAKPFRVSIKKQNIIPSLREGSGVGSKNEESEISSSNPSQNKNNIPSLREGSGVGSSDLEIEVLGTEFNINAYHDESGKKITLIEGSVKIKSNTTEKTIKPGQQAQQTKNNTLEIKNNVDIEEVMAWKNGRFLFNGTTIETIMKQAARWYDVTIEYKGKLPQVNYMGDVSRQENISELLNILEQTGTIHFTIEGKKVIVTP